MAIGTEMYALRDVENLSLERPQRVKMRRGVILGPRLLTSKTDPVFMG